MPAAFSLPCLLHAPQSSQALSSVLTGFAHLLACPHISFRGCGAREGLGNREHLGAERQEEEGKLAWWI